jgi:hypothetical protein
LQKVFRQILTALHSIVLAGTRPCLAWGKMNIAKLGKLETRKYSISADPG